MADSEFKDRFGVDVNVSKEEEQQLREKYPYVMDINAERLDDYKIT